MSGQRTRPSGLVVPCEGPDGFRMDDRGAVHCGLCNGLVTFIDGRAYHLDTISPVPAALPGRGESGEGVASLDAPLTESQKEQK